jgi:hypothetical protein
VQWQSAIRINNKPSTLTTSSILLSFQPSSCIIRRSLPLKPQELTTPANKSNNTEKVKVMKLLHVIVPSIHGRGNVYHWKIIGGSPERLSELLGCSHLLMCHVLSMCDLYDTEKCSYQYVDNNWKIFEPCQLIPSHMKYYD